MAEATTWHRHDCFLEDVRYNGAKFGDGVRHQPLRVS
jgi:hypothetical protein